MGDIFKTMNMPDKTEQPKDYDLSKPSDQRRYIEDICEALKLTLDK